MEARDEVPEDQFQCYYCTDFAYISVIHCTYHKYHYCISHQVLCQCPPEHIKLIYRFSSRELDLMERKISEACRQAKPLVKLDKTP